MSHTPQVSGGLPSLLPFEPCLCHRLQPTYRNSPLPSSAGDSPFIAYGARACQIKKMKGMAIIPSILIFLGSIPPLVLFLTTPPVVIGMGTLLIISALCTVWSAYHFYTFDPDDF